MMLWHIAVLACSPVLVNDQVMQLTGLYNFLWYEFSLPACDNMVSMHFHICVSLQFSLLRLGSIVELFF